MRNSVPHILEARNVLGRRRRKKGLGDFSCSFAKTVVFAGSVEGNQCSLHDPVVID